MGGREGARNRWREGGREEGESRKGRSNTDAPQDRKETREDEGRRAC